MDLHLRFREQDLRLSLLPERAFFWRARRLLGLSDVHLGKAESLQHRGINVPRGAQQEDFDRLERLIAQQSPEQVIILGDLVHDKNSWSEALRKQLSSFFNHHRTIKWTLLIGNHERGSLAHLEALPLELLEDDLTVGPFHFTHGHKPPLDDEFRIQGHVHPVVNLKYGSTRLRLPCFALTKKSLTIPSFGSLTGGYEIHPKDYDQLYACTPSRVLTLKPTKI